MPRRASIFETRGPLLGLEGLTPFTMCAVELGQGAVWVGPTLGETSLDRALFFAGLVACGTEPALCLTDLGHQPVEPRSLGHDARQELLDRNGDASSLVYAQSELRKLHSFDLLSGGSPLKHHERLHPGHRARGSPGRWSSPVRRGESV